VLGELEARSAKTGKSPRAFKKAPSTQTARLLTVLVEFDPNAGDDFSGYERPAFVGAEECVTEPAGTLLGGPLHNNMPNPATVGRGTDNNTFWVPDFSPSHDNKLIYTTSGLTQRVRPDLTGPDGRPGVDLRGYTVKNHYRFVIIHAGADKADGGGAGGTYSIWSHASNVDPATGGYAVPGQGVKVSNYIMQAEDAGVGVISHEYGHDLGLPDLYDTSGAADSDVDFWDLMASGSHTGPLFQTIPVHMGLWDKYVLGWVDPETFGVGSSGRDVKVGQASRTPKGTEDGVRVNLPEKSVTLAEPHSGEAMWYSNNDQSWADVKVSRTLEVPAGGDVRFWAWNNYDIEELWDDGFYEVSTDGGASWTQLEVFDATGAVVSTNEDPNGRLVDYGGLRNGITGTTGGEWRHYYVNLTPYAGTTIGLRLRYATEAGFEAPGWFADDFEVTADGAPVFTDDVEGGVGGWTAEQGTFTDTEGAGWIITSGTFVYQHYYLAEWRNYTPYNAPGMLVWYRDGRYTVNHVTTPIFAPPSTGSKGQLLIVDSHFDPLRCSGEAAEHDPSVLKNLPSRAQSLQRGLRQAWHPPVPRVHRGSGGLIHDLLQRPRPAGLRRWFAYLPEILPVARALEAAAINGGEGGVAWRDRMGDLRELFAAAVERVQRAGRLADGWSVATATDWVWARAQPATFQHLVGDRAWPPADYVDRAVRSVLSEVVA
jgi:hypothetical protein